MAPKLSIIIATHNSEKVIFSCLKSIQQQHFSDYEILIIDGASSDDTLNVVKSFNFTEIYIISEPDKGVYDAWNKGLGLARGEWIAFIGSDDVYATPNALSNLIEFGERQSESPFVYGKMATLDQTGSTVHITGFPWRSHKGILQKYVYVQFPFPIMASIYRRRFIAAQRFDQKYKIVGDMDLFLRCLNSWTQGPPVFLDTIVVKMGWGGISTNSKFYWINIFEAYKYFWTNNISILNLGLTKRSVKMLISISIRFLIGVEFDQKIRNFIWRYKISKNSKNK